MPFSKTRASRTEEYWTRHYEFFLKPLIEEVPGVEAKRSEASHGDILDEIITDLVTSPVVIADLTDANPNVYWELGVRQSFVHGTITIAQSGTRRVFDLVTKGTLSYYPHDVARNEQFRRKFKQAITDCLLDPETPDSRVLQLITGRGSLFKIFQRDQATRRLNAVLSEHNLNVHVLDNALTRAESNLRDPSHRASASNRFQWSAIEWLVVERYLDETETFYSSAEKYLDTLRVLNDKLERWSSNSNVISRWLLEQASRRRIVFERFNGRLAEAQARLGLLRPNLW